MEESWILHETQERYVIGLKRQPLKFVKPWNMKIPSPFYFLLFLFDANKHFYVNFKFVETSRLQPRNHKTSWSIIGCCSDRRHKAFEKNKHVVILNLQKWWDSTCASVLWMKADKVLRQFGFPFFLQKADQDICLLVVKNMTMGLITGNAFWISKNSLFMTGSSFLHNQPAQRHCHRFRPLEKKNP